MRWSLQLWRVLVRRLRCVTRAFQRLLLSLVNGRSARAFGRRKSVLAPATLRLHAPKPSWVRDEIIRLKVLFPDAGCRTLAHLFNRRFAAMTRTTVGKTFVHEIIQQHQYEIDVLRRKLKHRRPRPVAHNLIWAMDLTGKGDARGEQLSLLGIQEHRSRACLTLKALANKSTVTLLRCLLDAIERFGPPKILRTDNEVVFTSRLFRFALRVLGNIHQRSQPAHPWQNGRIERFFGTLKHPLDQWQVRCREELSSALHLFRFWYNHVRPHDYLDGRTPAEVWRGLDPLVQRPKEQHEFHAWDGLLTGYYQRRYRQTLRRAQSRDATQRPDLAGSVDTQTTEWT